MLDDQMPIFVQIADEVADDIASGALAEGDRVPSSNEFAAFHHINPATAAKGIALLVERGIVEKRRGIGMFVTAGARQSLVDARRAEFANRYVAPLVDEARRLGMTYPEVTRAIADAMGSEDPATATATTPSATPAGPTPSPVKGASV